MPDINFDNLADRFQRNIYGTTKGKIRLDIVWRDLLEAIPELSQNVSFEVLDAGCGMAQISARLAAANHRISLNDISEKMLQAAKDVFQLEQPDRSYKILHQPLQQVRQQYPQSFDLVMNHAVLEWLGQPKAALDDLLATLKPGGYLSLMFFNIHSLVFRNLVRGNLYKVKREDWSGTGEGSLTPINPLYPDQVRQWLVDAGMSTLVCSGVRVFQDYLLRDIRGQVSDADIVEAELRFSRELPYREMGRYIHVVCKKE